MLYLDLKDDVIRLFKGTYDSNEEKSVVTINSSEYSIVGEKTINRKDVEEGFSVPISITESHKNFKLKFVNCSFEKIELDGNINIKFQDCTFNHVSITGSTSTCACTFLNGSIENLSGSLANPKFENVIINQLTYSFQLNLKGFKSINSLIFERVQGSREIDLGNVNNITLIDFTVDTKKTFKGIKFKKGSNLIVKNSDLNGLAFFNCDLSKTILKIEKSNLTDLRYVNTKLPKKAIENENGEDSVEAYRQLKIVSKRHYDRFNELKYKALEQDAYLKSLKFPNDFNSLVVLGFSRFSNCYGTKWWPSLLLILFVGFSFYCWYLSTICNNIFGYEEFSEKYWQFISPFHNMQLLGDSYNYSGWSYIIDIFHRIINYFLIYQGVQAFRMYGKS